MPAPAPAPAPAPTPSPAPAHTASFLPPTCQVLSCLLRALPAAADHLPGAGAEGARPEGAPEGPQLLHAHQVPASTTSVGTTSQCPGLTWPRRGAPPPSPWATAAGRTGGRSASSQRGTLSG